MCYVPPLRSSVVEHAEMGRKMVETSTISRSQYLMHARVDLSIPARYRYWGYRLLIDAERTYSRTRAGSSVAPAKVLSKPL